MKAISIMQPWAWLILYRVADFEGWIKDIENRTWAFDYHGLLGIHAGLTYDFCGHGWIEKHRKIAIPADLPRGGLLGVVKQDGMVTESENPFFFGPYGHVYKQPIPFEKMIPCPGRQRIFEVDFPFDAPLGGGVSLRYAGVGR